MKFLDSWLFLLVLLFTVLFLFFFLVRLINQLSPHANAAKAMMIAKGYLLLGRKKDAYEESRNAVELDSENAEAHSLLANLLLERGAVNEAAEQIKQAVQFETQNDAYWRDLGLILLLLSIRQKEGLQLNESSLEEAMFVFRQAYRLDPSNVCNRLHVDMIEASTGLTTSSNAGNQWIGWPALVHRFFRKKLNEAECFDGIAEDGSEEHLGEAHLYVALYYLISADFPAAKRNFRASYWHGSAYDAACKEFLRELRA
jgi:tetratricopeptide (TPR) repeat protein